MSKFDAYKIKFRTTSTKILFIKQIQKGRQILDKIVSENDLF